MSGKRRRSRKARPYIVLRRRPPANRLVMSIHTWLQALRHVWTNGESTWGPARRAAEAIPPRCSECGHHLDHSHDYRDHLPLAES